jgi:hypothetical protein
MRILAKRNGALCSCNVHRLLAVVFLTSLPVSAFAQRGPNPWLILATGDKGSINVHTTRQDLVRNYGAPNVIDRDVDVGEGETQPGTVLFPNDPERSLEILWNTAGVESGPSCLTIRGDKSKWKALHDISLGTSLKQLEHLNGKPFHMAGYGWDYAGTVMSWDQGALAQDLGEFDPQGTERGRVILRLTCGATSTKPTDDREAAKIAGDGKFLSSHPVLQKMNPCVGEMVWIFPENAKN